MLSLLATKADSFFEEFDTDFHNYSHLPFRGLNLSSESEVCTAQLKGSRTLKAICILSSYSIEFLHLQEYRTLIDEIRQFYFGNDTIDESSLLKYYEFLSDINFFWGIDQSVKHLAASSKGKTFYMWYGTFDSI